MTCYVDNPRNKYGRMRMAHLCADSTAELLAMAARIGLKKQWLQNAGKWSEHFDVAQSKRRAALAAGAVPVTSKELVRILRAKKR